MERSHTDTATLHPELLRELRHIEETDDPRARLQSLEELSATVDERLWNSQVHLARLGNRHELEAIIESRLSPLADSIVAASRWIIVIDAIFWFLSALSTLDLSWIVLAPASFLLAVALARGAKLIAQLWLPDPTSIARTQRRYRFAAGCSLAVAALGGVLLAMAAFAPENWATWILALGFVPLVLLNVGLPLTAGVLAALGEMLSKPWEHVRLSKEIEHLCRFRSRLQSYSTPYQSNDAKRSRIGVGILLIVALALGGSIQPAQAQHSCAMFIDETDSVEPHDRGVAIDFLEETLGEITSVFDCSSLVAGRFSDHARFAPRQWIPVPVPPQEIDCTTVDENENEAPHVLYRTFSNVTKYRRQQAIESCRRDQAEEQQQYLEQTSSFARRLRSAVEVSTPRTDRGTDIRGFLESIAESERIRVVVLVTDGLETPRRTVGNLSLQGLTVVMVLTAPNEKYARLDEVLRAAEAWAKVPGVSVVTTAELHPSIWRDLTQVDAAKGRR